MALMGKGAVVLWTSMKDRASHDHWHSHEHLPERIGIPGFLRGRRCAAINADEAEYFVIYEVATVQTMTSPGYLARLNNPTEWTRKTMTTVRSANRTLCDVAASFGAGLGADVATIRLKPAEGFEETLAGWIAGRLAEIVHQPGVTGAHLLTRCDDIERPETRERELRGHADGSEHWIVVVEGYDPRAVAHQTETLLSDAELNARGIHDAVRRNQYKLAHVLEASEMEHGDPA